MTEIVSGVPAGDAGQAAGAAMDQAAGRPEVIRRGLSIERVFTTPGVHP